MSLDLNNIISPPQPPHRRTYKPRPLTGSSSICGQGPGPMANVSYTGPGGSSFCNSHQPRSKRRGFGGAGTLNFRKVMRVSGGRRRGKCTMVMSREFHGRGSSECLARGIWTWFRGINHKWSGRSLSRLPLLVECFRSVLRSPDLDDN